MLAEFVLINYFLYGALGVCGISAGAILLGKDKTEKLANNRIINPKGLKEVLGEDGLNLTKNIRLKKEKDYEGICLIGPTGAYKTSTLFMNNLLDDKIQGSIIVTDPKGELFEKTSGYQEEVCKRKVYKLDFMDVARSEKYNLLENCKSEEEVIALASTLLVNGALSIELMTSKKTGGAEWIMMAEPLFASVLLYVKDFKKPFNTVEFALSLLTNLKTSQLEKLIKNSGNLAAETQFLIFMQVGGADRTEGSIRITLATNTKLFTDRTVNKINGDTTFNIEDFRSEESILYIIYPERKSSYLAPFIAPFFSQIMDKSLDNYSNKSLPIHFMFDEFGNLGMLNNFSINAATVRSRKISLSVCLQSISQLYQIYGNNSSKSILNNLKTKIVLPGITDVETLNYISTLCGFKEIEVKSKSQSGGKSSYSTSKTKRKIFEEGELRTLPKKQALIITDNKMPVLDDLEPYFETEKESLIIDPAKYKTLNSSYVYIKEEIERIKAENFKEEEDEDGFEETTTRSKATAITRRIFTKEE